MSEKTARANDTPLDPLARVTKRVDCPALAAHGFVQVFINEKSGFVLFPYRVDRERIDGENVHIWLKDHVLDEGQVAALVRIAFRYTEAIGFTVSAGMPSSFVSYNLLRKKP